MSANLQGAAPHDRFDPSGPNYVAVAQPVGLLNFVELGVLLGPEREWNELRDDVVHPRLDDGRLVELREEGPPPFCVLEPLNSFVTVEL